MAKKSRSYIPIYEDVLPRVNALPFEQAGMILFLMGEISSSSPAELEALAESLNLDPEAEELWQEICHDITAYLEKRQAISNKNKHNASKRWNTQCEGQKNLLFEVAPTSDPDEPELIARAPGLPKKGATALYHSEVRPHTDATASPIYNNTNNINNTNTITNTISITESEYEDAIASIRAIVPNQEICIRLFRMNGCYDEYEATKFYLHYSKRGWTTKEGRKLTDFQMAVKLWIHRANEWHTRRFDRNRDKWISMADEVIQELRRSEEGVERYEKIG